MSTASRFQSTQLAPVREMQEPSGDTRSIVTGLGERQGGVIVVERDADTKSIVSVRRFHDDQAVLVSKDQQFVYSRTRSATPTTPTTSRRLAAPRSTTCSLLQCPRDAVRRPCPCIPSHRCNHRRPVTHLPFPRSAACRRPIMAKVAGSPTPRPARPSCPVGVTTMDRLHHPLSPTSARTAARRPINNRRRGARRSCNHTVFDIRVVSTHSLDSVPSLSSAHYGPTCIIL